MKNLKKKGFTNSKGFTIVELVIVIAVIAILSAVLIPTFSNLIKKANISADKQAVKEMNTALVIGSVDSEPKDITEVANILSEAGYNSKNGLTPLCSNYYFYWYKPTNQIVYVDETDGAFSLVFPLEIEGFPSVKNTDCQPLKAAIDAVIEAPEVIGTTVEVKNDVFNNSHNVDLPLEVNNFNTLMNWLTNDTNKKLTCTINGANKPGIIFPSGDIKLTEDIILDTPNHVNGVGNTLVFNIIGETTIDLNGFKIEQYGDGRSLNLFSVRNGGVLNIIDSSESKTGKICASLGMFQVDAGGTVNLFSGTLCATDEQYRTDADIEAGLSIVSMNGGTFNMYGGVINAISCTLHDYHNYEYAISGYSVSTSVCNLYAGTINGVAIDDNGFGGTLNNYGVQIN